MDYIYLDCRVPVDLNQGKMVFEWVIFIFDKNNKNVTLSHSLTGI